MFTNLEQVQARQESKKNKNTFKKTAMEKTKKVTLDFQNL